MRVHFKFKKMGQIGASATLLSPIFSSFSTSYHLFLYILLPLDQF